MILNEDIHMFDIIVPEDNELELIKIAEKLGWKELCLAYDKPKDIDQFRKKTDMKLISGIISKQGSESKFKGKADLILSRTSDASTARSLAEQGLTNILFGLENSERPDFIHHRNSGLNHVICKLMVEKNISICFDFSEILKSNGKSRAVLLGRMRQNLKFAKKYNIEIIFASFAGSQFGIRSPETFISLKNILD